MAGGHTPAKRAAEDGAANERPSKRQCCNYDDVVTILAGPEEHRFIAHKDVICAKSNFFKAACSDRWREGQEKVVRLPEVRSVWHFQMYMDWAYDKKTAVDNFQSLKTESYMFTDLIELYLLGDVLQDFRLRNKILQA